MRRYIIAAGLVAGLGLSACGSGPATLDSAVASLSSTSSLEVHLTASFAGPGASEVEQYAKSISMDVTEVNPSGAPLSQASALDEDVSVNVGSGVLLEVREVAGNAYLKMDLTELNTLPNVNLPASDIAAVQLLFGGRWFEVPASLIKSLTKKESTPQNAAASKTEQADARKITKAFEHIIETAPATTLAGGGYSETATIQSLISSLWPTIQSLGLSSVTEPTDVKGSYTLSMTTSGSTITGGTVSITAPASSGAGNDTVAFSATVNHNAATVSAPSGATVVSKQLIQQLENEAQSPSLAN